jgi:CRISPR-associated protein Csx17
MSTKGTASTVSSKSTMSAMNGPLKTVLLGGLQPQPLAAYLGALGVLRVLGTQAGPGIKAGFSPSGLLVEGVDREEVMALLLDNWEPSPVLTPWNNASGFYDSSKGNQARAALEAIVASRNPRFRPLAAVIKQVRALITGDEAPKDEEKALFISSLRSVLPDAALPWLDAVSVVTGDEAKMMPLLGSGGNEGVLDYSGLYLRSLVDTVLSGDPATSGRLLESALFGETCAELLERPGGQFDPGSAGGFNTGPGFESKGLPNNPWSFLLLVEGAMSWASGIASRQRGQATSNPFAVSPFTVRHVAAGYPSAGRAEEDPQKVRAEIWVPVWEKPASLAEVERFIAEGRVEVRGRKGTMQRANDSLDFADAVASLGVDRGVSAFVRYAFTKRRGDSYIALPAGQLSVSHRSEIDLLRQLDGQLDMLDSQFLRRFPGDGPPAMLLSLRRSINDARFEVSAKGGPASVGRLVRALGALERTLARRDPGKSPKLPRPLGGLGAEWVDACESGPEVRLAAAVASLARTGAAGPFRAYVAPLNPAKDWEYAPANRTLAWSGASLADRLASVLNRRLLDARLRTSAGTRGDRNPTWGPRQVSLADVGDFLEPGLIDEQALEELLFGFTWVKHERPSTASRSDPGGVPVPRHYALLKLLFLPDGIPVSGERLVMAPDPSIVPLLTAGRVDDAIALARRQLSAKGLRPRHLPDWGAHDAGFGTRLAASLLIPMFQTDALVRNALLRNTEEPTAAQETA